MLGFGCRQEESELRVGPLSMSEGITEEEVQQQDRYMMRTWVELNLFLHGYIKNGRKSRSLFLILLSSEHRPGPIARSRGICRIS